MKKEHVLSVRFDDGLLSEARDVAAKSSRSFSDWVRSVISCAVMDARSPVRELPQPSPGPGTFACPHFSIGQVDSAWCATCGPLQRAA